MSPVLAPTIFVPLENTLGELSRSAVIVISGPLAKLSESGTWRPRFFALTRTGALFLYKMNPMASTPPVTFLPVDTAISFYNRHLQTWIITATGIGINTDGATVSREWTLACEDEASCDLWIGALKAVIASPNVAAAKPVRTMASLSAIRRNGGELDAAAATAAAAGRSQLLRTGSLMVRRPRVESVQNSDAVPLASSRVEYINVSKPSKKVSFASGPPSAPYHLGEDNFPALEQQGRSKSMNVQVMRAALPTIHQNYLDPSVAKPGAHVRLYSGYTSDSSTPDVERDENQRGVDGNGYRGRIMDPLNLNKSWWSRVFKK
ncbi:hypothetical protein HDU83_005835 [Entophlyctis luteolus]|nr:hypothetical protein HDU83_005835 [Entophlyctis luteolus]KAJ3382591.1 hypothetical protein HDU84_004199 [Entophlyctis sp. JEL0112]